MKRTTRTTGAKLLQLTSGKWLTHSQEGYHCGIRHVTTEDAMITLLEHLQIERGLDHRLARKLPSEDYSLFRSLAQRDWLDREREEHEKWIIEMLRSATPPYDDTFIPWDGESDWERLHRVAVSTCPIRSCILRLLLTFSDAELWAFVQAHREAESPLRRWRVVIERESSPGDLETEIMWAYSEETLGWHWGFHYRRVISAEQLLDDDILGPLEPV